MSLQYAILGLLNYQPLTGYDLKTVFDKSINHFWSAQLSQIYRDLGTLEGKEYVTSHIEPQEGRPDKKIYSVTEKGQKAFDEWLAKFPQSLGCPVRDEFLVRIFFGAQLSPVELDFHLKRYIKELKENLQYFTTVETIIADYAQTLSRPDDKFYWRLTLKKGHALAEASIRWAEECIKELEEKAKEELR